MNSVKITLKLEKIISAARVNPRMIELSSAPDQMMEDIVIRCVRQVLYWPQTPRISHPTTWWDHFKVRWFPLWAKQRWPPQFTIWEARCYFPEKEMPRRGFEEEIHFFDWKAIKKPEEL